MADRFRNLVTELTTEFATKKVLLEEQEKRLNEERQRLNKEKELMAKVQCNNKDVVHLNVGGTVFATKRGALRLIPGSVLELMFSGRWEDRVDRDKDGLVFLDYDPYLFSIILRYLIALHNYGMAADHLRLRPIESYLEEEFRLMLSHLGLSQIIQPAFEFKWSPVLKTQNVKLCNRDSVAISQGDGLLRHHALSHDVFYGGVFKFNVYVDFLEEWAMLGIIGSDVHLTTSDNACNDASTYGWGSNGEVFVQGIESSKKGYPGRPFKTGDHLTLVLDGRYSTLTMKTCVDDVTLEYKIPNLMGKEWRLVLATYYGSSAIEVTSN